MAHTPGRAVGLIVWACKILAFCGLHLHFSNFYFPFFNSFSKGVFGLVTDYENKINKIKQLLAGVDNSVCRL